MDGGRGGGAQGGSKEGKEGRPAWEGRRQREREPERGVDDSSRHLAWGRRGGLLAQSERAARGSGHGALCLASITFDEGVGCDPIASSSLGPQCSARASSEETRMRRRFETREGRLRDAKGVGRTRREEEPASVY